MTLSEFFGDRFRLTPGQLQALWARTMLDSCRADGSGGFDAARAAQFVAEMTGHPPIAVMLAAGTSGMQYVERQKELLKKNSEKA